MINMSLDYNHWKWFEKSGLPQPQWALAMTDSASLREAKGDEAIQKIRRILVH
jgi:hypothetical protein